MKRLILWTATCITFWTATGNSEEIRVEGGFPYVWGGYGTSLKNRSEQQRHNARTAARDMNGVIIPPGGVFSFNELAGARDRSKGYSPAPIITATGQMQETPGGGICQLASTIYNAGLLAGMDVVERHPHSRSVTHVPPGRDATISSWRKDLKLRNKSSLPMQMVIEMDDYRITVSFRATTPRPFTVEITSDRHKLEPETVVFRNLNPLPAQAGASGYATTTRRIITQGKSRTEETISIDRYPPPSRVTGTPR